MINLIDIEYQIEIFKLKLKRRKNIFIIYHLYTYF